MSQKVESQTHESIVRKHQLSEKEKAAKDRLFKRGPNSQKGRLIPDDARPPAPMIKPVVDKVVDKQIEHFMKDMTEEVKKMNQGSS